jgi:hypothetical protein
MIAITIGVGRYAEMAVHAAGLLARQTGLRTRVLGPVDFASSGLRHPHDLKFRLFDFSDDPDVLYFDADLVCLRPWDPLGFRGCEGLIAVRDLVSDMVRAEAQRADVPVDDYFNSGFFIANRERHATWLRAAERVAEQYRKPFVDQTALNAARRIVGLPFCPVERKYNWLNFGDRGVCCETPVLMAHRLRPGDNRSNLQYYAGRYSPPFRERFVPDEEAAAPFVDRRYRLSVANRDWGIVRLRGDGTFVPARNARAPGHWFVHRSGGRLLLAVCSATEHLVDMALEESGDWVGLRPGMPARLSRPGGSASEDRILLPTEREVWSGLLAQCLFEYERVGHDQRFLELLADGSVGHGAADCERAWYVELAADGVVELVIAAWDSVTCRLRQREDGDWIGRWLAHEKMPVRLGCPR